MNQIQAVDFHGHQLLVINHNGQPYTAMKAIVEGMGMSWQPQHEKLKSSRFQSTITEIVTVAEDGKQRAMTCLPLRKLAGWLMTIHPNKVKPEIRANVITYQNECDDALWDYWTQGVAVKPAPALSSKITAEQARTLQEAVAERADTLPKHLRPAAFPKLWGAIKTHFRVPTYRDLPEAQYIAALSLISRLPLDGEHLAPEPAQPLPPLAPGRYLVVVSETGTRTVVDIAGKNVIPAEEVFAVNRDLRTLAQACNEMAKRASVLVGAMVSPSILDKPLSI